MMCLGAVMNEGRSAFVIFPTVEYGFTHATSILLALMLPCPHVDVAYDFAPVGLNVEFSKFFLVDSFLG